MNIFMLAMIVWAALGTLRTVGIPPWLESLGIGTDPAVDDAQERAKEAAAQQAGSAEEANKLYIDYMNRALGVQARSMEEQKAASLAAMLMQLGLAGGADQTFRQMLNAAQAQQLPYQTARVSALQSLPVLQAMAGVPAYRLPSDVSTVDFTSGRPDFRAIFEAVAKLSNARMGSTGTPGDGTTPQPQPPVGPQPPTVVAKPGLAEYTAALDRQYGPGNWVFSTDLPPGSDLSGGSAGGKTVIPLTGTEDFSAWAGGPAQASPSPAWSPAKYLASSGQVINFTPEMGPMVRVPIQNYSDQLTVARMGGTGSTEDGWGFIPNPTYSAPPVAQPTQPATPASTPTPTTPTPATPTGGATKEFDDLIKEILASGVFPTDGGDLTTTTTPLERFTPEYSYEDSPLYKFRKEEAEKASGRALRARGMYGSETGALITAREQERIAAEEAENQYRRVADLVNIGLGGQATAGQIPTQAGQQISSNYAGLGQDLSQGLNQAAQARSGLYGQQQNMLQQFGTGLAENTAQIGAAKAAATANSYTPVQPGNIFDTILKGYSLYSGLGGGTGGFNLFGSGGSSGIPTAPASTAWPATDFTGGTILYPWR